MLVGDLVSCKSQNLDSFINERNTSRNINITNITRYGLVQEIINETDARILWCGEIGSNIVPLEILRWVARYKKQKNL